MLKTSLSLLLSTVLFTVSALAGGPKVTIQNPDLTKGEPTP